MSNLSIDKVCCICLENDNSLIEYNHCGLYYVHRKCLNNWTQNECIICRKKITLDARESSAVQESSAGQEDIESGNLAADNNDLRFIPYNYCNSNIFIKIILFNFCSLSLYILVNRIMDEHS